MRVIRAATMGFCFGVRDALAIAEAIADPESFTIHGELVHNEGVLSRLKSAGFRVVAEAERASLDARPNVLITAHGVSDVERARLLAAQEGEPAAAVRPGGRPASSSAPIIQRPAITSAHAIGVTVSGNLKPSFRAITPSTAVIKNAATSFSR